MKVKNQKEKKEKKYRKILTLIPQAWILLGLQKREIKSWATVRDKSNASSLSFGRRH